MPSVVTGGQFLEIVLALHCDLETPHTMSTCTGQYTTMKQITLEEAQLLYDLGATVYWKSAYGVWVRCSTGNVRPGTGIRDAQMSWGVQEDG